MNRVNASGAIRELGKLNEMLAEMRGVPRRVAIDVAPKLTALLRRQFAEGRDPYGRAWRPLRPATLKKHGPPPLTHTGTLGDRTEATSMRSHYAGIRFRMGASYGVFHQIGFRVGRLTVRPRRILPQFGIPSEWRAALDRVAREAATKATRRAR